MMRHLALGATFAVLICSYSFTARAAEQMPLSTVITTTGEEKEVCTGAKAAITPNPPKFGELRFSGSEGADTHIFYKPKDTSITFIENLECKKGEQMQIVHIVSMPKRSPVSGFSDEAYPEAFKALFLLFVLAVVLESALAIVFNWRPFIETYNSRAVKPVVSLLFAIGLVYMFEIDLVTSLARLVSPHVSASDHTGRILTAMVIAGGSAAVNQLMLALGFRPLRSPETVSPPPPANKGWISVSIVRTDKIRGPVTVGIGVKDANDMVPVVASLNGSTIPAYRYFLRDRGRFPGSGGYTVAKGDNITVTVSASKARGNGTVNKTWGPNIIADGAIIDLTFEMTE